MIKIFISTVSIFAISIIMAMTGRGGGNFYVPVLVATGNPIHQAATTGQLILIATALAALLVFQKHKTVDWKLALVIDPPTDIMAFFGGYYAHGFSSEMLKLIFAGLLALASFFMLSSIKKQATGNGKRFGFWQRQYGSFKYTVNLWLALPITTATGFVAGMVGISGGSFKIPLMVLACGVPMRIAVGTSSAMVAATALMGFSGHLLGGDFNPHLAVPIAVVAVVGGILGGKFSLKTNPENLKRIFAYTTLVASAFMIFNALLSTS